MVKPRSQSQIIGKAWLCLKIQNKDETKSAAPRSSDRDLIGKATKVFHIYFIEKPGQLLLLVPWTLSL